MHKVRFVYIYFLSGVLFLLCAGAFYTTEDLHLTPVFASIGLAIISISFVLYSRSQACKK